MDRAQAPAHEAGLPTVKGPARLLCYALNDHPPRLVPTDAARAWMDAYANRHPYRCLPLNIANAHGWSVLMPVPIEVEWNGGDDLAALTVRGLKPFPDGRPLDHFCRSNFGHGIVTLHTDYIFRTEPGWDLLATGPFNAPKDGCAPLTGIMEADWLPYPFTMNWKLTRPGTIRFDEDEPFCFVFPLPKQALIDTVPEIRRLEDDPELVRQHDAFRLQRDGFLARQRAGDAEAIRQGWQRYYFTGRHPDGTEVGGHLSKLRLHEPVDRRSAPGGQPGPPRRAGPWEAGSPLELIDPGQTDANRLGRARVSRDGTLAATPATRRIASAADAAGCDFLCVENMLSGAECLALRRAFARLSDRLFVSHQMDPYWNNRFVWLADFIADEPEAAAIMMAQAERARAALARFYRLTAPIYNDLLQIVQWPEGIAMPPHADCANPDGSPHGMAHRDFAGVTYLNDDYQGGELYLTALDISVKPRAGMFLGFTAGFHHEHAVLRVTGGATRLTVPTFYTFDPTKAEPRLHPGVAEAAKRTEPAARAE